MSRFTHLATCLFACAAALACSGDLPPVVDGVGADVDGGAGCAGTETRCPAGCADLRRDEANCGGCGVACAEDERCVDGGCVLNCPRGFVVCAGRCVDPATDEAHCGATADCAGANAGTACPPGAACAGGACTSGCPPPFVTCGGACADPRTDERFCGATADCAGANAGTACASGTACRDGKCEPTCATSAACTGAASVCRDGACAVPWDCAELEAGKPGAIDGAYTVDLDGPGPRLPQSVWCDMTTDGGGWTVVSAITGADGEEPLTSDVARAGNPFAGAHYNADRATKLALAALSTESLFARTGSGVWLEADRPMFDANLGVAGSVASVAVTLLASDGSTAPGFMGYATTGIPSGGDFGITVSPDGKTYCGTTVNGFDNHNKALYWNLNCGCERHYLYSYSAGAGDGDAGYDVNTALGAWAATQACEGAEGGALKFRAAMRRRLSKTRACKALLGVNAGETPPSGVYLLDPDGDGPGPAAPTYCDLSPGGGWTLLASATASGTLLGNNAAAWKSAAPVGAAPATLVGGDFKAHAYGALVTDEVRLCVGGATRCHVFKHGKQATLLSFFANDVSYVEYAKDVMGYGDVGSDAARTAFLSELGYTSATATCYWLGINHLEASPTEKGLSALGLMGDTSCGCKTYNAANVTACAGNTALNDLALGLGLSSCNDANGCPPGGSGHKAGTSLGVNGVAASGDLGPWFVFGR